MCAAQLTGVLAGFAFTALVLVLTPSQARRREGGDDTGAPLGPLDLFLWAAASLLTIVGLMFSAADAAQPAGVNAENGPAMRAQPALTGDA